MRVLLDECLPRRLKRELVGHDVRTAPEMGWASKTNGELLTLAAADFDVFLTSDRNLQAQRSEKFAYDVPRPVHGTQNFFYRASCRGIEFVPLVIRIRYMECQLQIDWHRHDPPGTILSPNGDIDNRLKTLFDALRMPQNDSEIPADAINDGVFFCLLEDDSLITKLSVNTSQIPAGHVVISRWTPPLRRALRSKSMTSTRAPLVLPRRPRRPMRCG